MTHHRPDEKTQEHIAGKSKALGAWRAGWFVLAGALMALGAHAQGGPAGPKSDGPIQIELTQHLVVIEGGKEVLRPADKVKPGDLIEYRANYVNRGDKPVEGFVATLPIPVGLEYVPRSAAPAAPTAQAALLDGRYAVEPLMRTVPGKAEPEVVPYVEYRSVRWTLKGVQPRGRGQVSVRARVSSTSVDAQAASVGVSVSATRSRVP